jgi:hypothetical protein
MTCQAVSTNIKKHGKGQKHFSCYIHRQAINAVKAGMCAVGAEILASEWIELKYFAFPRIGG